MTKPWRLWLLTGLLLLFAGCQKLSPAPAEARTPVPLLQIPSAPDGLPVLADVTPDSFIEHDTNAFTQGLLFFEGKLYESTGQRGQSKVRRLAPDGSIEAETALDEKYFGEGLAQLDGRLYQLTWQSGVCLVYQPSDLALTQQLFYGTEGWGLTVDPVSKLFIFSDGSPELRFLKPDTLITDHKLVVTDGNGQAVPNLNELEWVNGEIWANVWTSDAIARIDPTSGKVKSWLRFSKLVGEHQLGYEETLNGIAYDPDGDTLWITGKLWPRIYRFQDAKKKFFSK